MLGLVVDIYKNKQEQRHQYDQGQALDYSFRVDFALGSD